MKQFLRPVHETLEGTLEKLLILKTILSVESSECLRGLDIYREGRLRKVWEVTHFSPNAHPSSLRY